MAVTAAGVALVAAPIIVTVPMLAAGGFGAGGVGAGLQNPYH